MGGGARTEVDLLQIMARRAVLRGSTLRARPLGDKAAATELTAREVAGPLGSGAVRVRVEATYPLEAVQEAYERFAAGGKLGKIVLLTGEDDEPAGSQVAPKP